MVEDEVIDAGDFGEDDVEQGEESGKDCENYECFTRLARDHQIQGK